MNRRKFFSRAALTPLAYAAGVAVPGLATYSASAAPVIIRDCTIHGPLTFLGAKQFAVMNCMFQGSKSAINVK